VIGGNLAQGKWAVNDNEEAEQRENVLGPWLAIPHKY